MIHALLLACSTLVAMPVAAPVVMPVAPASVAAPIIQMEHISVEIMGKGPPVILIPGLASPRAAWDGVTPMLARTHSVYRVQVNGFGGSAPGANLSPGILVGIVADIHRLIEQRKLAGTAVIGHSMGGLVGLMLARSHPADIGKLMVVDALPFFAVLMAPPGVDVTSAMVEPQARLMRDGVAASFGKPLADEAAEAQTKGLALKADSIVTIKAWARAADPRVTGQAMYEDLTTDLRPDLAAIQTPITILFPWNAAGPTKEKAAPFYRRQYSTLPSVTFLDIGDAAHMVMLDQPAAFAAAVDTFLR